MYGHTILLILVGAVGAILSAVVFSNFSIIQFDKIPAGEFGTVMLGLILVALVIERATEIYLSVQVDPKIGNEALRQKTVSEAELRRARAAVSAEHAASSTF